MNINTISDESVFGESRRPLLEGEKREGKHRSDATENGESPAHSVSAAGDSEASEDLRLLQTYRVDGSFLYRCVFTAALGSLLLGYDLGL